MRTSYEHGLLCRLSFIGLRLATVAGHIQCKQYIKSIGILYSVKIGNGLERLELLSLMKCNRFLVDFHKWNKQQESASLLTDVILNILFSADHQCLYTGAISVITVYLFQHQCFCSPLHEKRVWFLIRPSQAVKWCLSMPWVGSWGLWYAHFRCELSDPWVYKISCSYHIILSKVSTAPLILSLCP